MCYGIQRFLNHYILFTRICTVFTIFLILASLFTISVLCVHSLNIWYFLHMFILYVSKDHMLLFFLLICCVFNEYFTLHYTRQNLINGSISVLDKAPSVKQL